MSQICTTYCKSYNMLYNNILFFSDLLAMVIHEPPQELEPLARVERAGEDVRRDLLTEDSGHNPATFLLSEPCGHYLRRFCGCSSSVVIHHEASHPVSTQMKMLPSEVYEQTVHSSENVTEARRRSFSFPGQSAASIAVVSLSHKWANPA